MDYPYEEAPVISQLGIREPIACHMQQATACSVCAPLHTHEYIEILYCLKGNYSIWLNGKFFNFSKGDMVVINSHEMHTIKSNLDGEYIVIKFVPDIIHAAGNSALEAKYITPFLINNSKHQRVFKATEIENTQIPEKILSVLEEYTSQSYGYELAMRTDIGGIFLWILRYWNSNNIDLSLDMSVNDSLAVQVQKVMDYISVNFQDAITVSFAAQMCNVSYSYFSRIFKQITKHSFSEYLNYVRITEAEKLLASTDLTMTEIAMQTGFSTSSYFIQQFKLHKHISPKQFRKNIFSSI